MNPGRELDALVAESVMGWKFAGGFTLEIELQSDRWATDGDGIERYFYEVPNYSTAIDAAWAVVEKTDLLFVRNLTLDSNGWAVFPDCGAAAISYGAETAAHAICLAALALVGDSTGIGRSELNK